MASGPPDRHCGTTRARKVWWSGDWTAHLKLPPLGIPPRSRGGGCQEIAKVLVNAGNFDWDRTAGDPVQLSYTHPTNEDDTRQVTVPLHDELRPGTLRDIADDAGANDFDAFCAWIDRNS